MNKLPIHISALLLLAVVYFISPIFMDPDMTLTFLISAYGFISVIGLLVAISLPILIKISRNSFTTYLLANRRWLGIYTFIFAAIHVFLVFNFFFHWNISNYLNNPNLLFLALGSISLAILALMALTSNNISMQKLGKNWKRLQVLIYPVIILVLIHATQVGIIVMKIGWLKYAVIALSAILIIIKITQKIKKKSLTS